MLALAVETVQIPAVNGLAVFLTCVWKSDDLRM